MKKILLAFIILSSISCSNNDSDNNLNEDPDIIVEENNGGNNNNCTAPSNLGVYPIGTTSATLQWYAFSQLYDIEYGPRGFTLGTGVKVATSDDEKEITGLTPYTQYDFYVRANCGGNNYSNWSVSSFITKGSARTSFTGEYRIEQITSERNNGPVLSSGTIVNIKQGTKENNRYFETRFMPKNCSNIYEFNFDLLSNNTIYVPLIKSNCTCNGNYFFGPAENDSTYNPNNDTEFYINFTDDVYNDCTGGSAQVIYKFTKV